MRPMRRRVLGSIGLTYGFAVLAYGLHSGIHGRTSPERVGEAVGFAVAIAIIYFSGRAVVRGIHERDHDDPSR